MGEFLSTSYFLNTNSRFNSEDKILYFAWLTFKLHALKFFEGRSDKNGAYDRYKNLPFKQGSIFH